MELELDVDKDVLEWSPLPPRRRLMDFIPAFITTPLRLWFGFPKPTPYEKWVVVLHVVRICFTGLVDREKAQRVAPFMSEAPHGTGPLIAPEDWN